LLVLDGHGSHFTAEFDRYCSNNSIVVLCMPPHSSHLLQAQTELLKRYLKRCSPSPPSPTDQALSRLVKGCEMAMHSVVLLASENKRLSTENARRKRKRAQRRMYVAKGGIFAASEALELINDREEEQAEAAEPPPTEARRRAPPRCSLCGSLEHKAPYGLASEACRYVALIN